MSDFVAKLRARTRPEICNCAIGIHLADGSEPDEDCVKAADTITRLTAEVAEYEATFDAAWEADMRGVQMWREAHPGNDMVLPDRANFTAWILTEIMRLRFLTISQETLIRKAEAESEKLRSALLVAHKYVLVQSCELSLMPEDAARDLAIIDEALEEGCND
jgi:hypothetical protein